LSVVFIKANIFFRFESCESYSCTVDIQLEDMCITYFKGQYDANCFIPCHLSNCSKTYEEMVLCAVYTCNQKMVPILPAYPVTHPGVIAAVSCLAILSFICLIILSILIVKTRRVLHHFRLRNDDNTNISNVDAGKLIIILKFKYKVLSNPLL
jgi:hypothetical protein